MRTIASALILCFTLLFLSAPRAEPAPASVGEPHLLKFGTMAPEISAWTEMPFTFLIPLIHDMFGDRIKLVVYFGGVMGDDSEVMRKIRLGQLHGCACTHQGMVMAVPELSALTLPMLFESYEEVDFILVQLRKYIENAFERQGFYLLFLIDTGFNYFFSKQDPSSLEKIRQMRILTWSGNIQRSTLQILGTSPIPVTVPEVTASLASNLTEAGMAPAAWLLSAQAHAHFRYLLDPPIYYAPSPGFIDKNRFDRIIQSLREHPEEFRQIRSTFRNFQKNVSVHSYAEHLGINKTRIREAMEAVIPWIREQTLERPEDVRRIFFGAFRQAEPAWGLLVRDFESECFEGFAQRGIQRVTLAETDLPKLLLVTRHVWDDYSGKLFPPSLLEGIRKRLVKFRSQRR